MGRLDRLGNAFPLPCCPTASAWPERDVTCWLEQAGVKPETMVAVPSPGTVSQLCRTGGNQAFLSCIPL